MKWIYIYFIYNLLQMSKTKYIKYWNIYEYIVVSWVIHDFLMLHICIIIASNLIYLSGIPIGIFQSMFQVVALETFNLPADQNGFLMAYIGILTMVQKNFHIKI